VLDFISGEAAVAVAVSFVFVFILRIVFRLGLELEDVESGFEIQRLLS